MGINSVKAQIRSNALNRMHLAKDRFREAKYDIAIELARPLKKFSACSSDAANLITHAQSIIDSVSIMNISEEIERNVLDGNLREAISLSSELKKYPNQASRSAEMVRTFEEQLKKKESEDFISSCISVAFAELLRNPSAYSGKHVEVTGKIGQKLGSTYFLDTDPTMFGYIGDKVAVEFSKEGLIEGDIVKFYCVSKGLKSYKNILGSEKETPLLEGRYFKFVKKRE